MTSRTSTSPESAVALREVLAFDDTAALRAVLVPAGLDVEVRGVAVGDEGGAQSLDGCLVLVIGAPAASAAAAGPVREAAGRGASGVVLRDTQGEATAPEVLAAAEESGIALLTRAEWADWADTAALLRSALACARAGLDEGAPDGTAGGAESLTTLASAVAEYTGARSRSRTPGSGCWPTPPPGPRPTGCAGPRSWAAASPGGGSPSCAGAGCCGCCGRLGT